MEGHLTLFSHPTPSEAAKPPKPVHFIKNAVFEHPPRLSGPEGPFRVMTLTRDQYWSRGERAPVPGPSWVLELWEAEVEGLRRCPLSGGGGGGVSLGFRVRVYLG